MKEKQKNEEIKEDTYNEYEDRYFKNKSLSDSLFRVTTVFLLAGLIFGGSSSVAGLVLIGIAAVSSFVASSISILNRKNKKIAKEKYNQAVISYNEYLKQKILENQKELERLESQSKEPKRTNINENQQKTAKKELNENQQKTAKKELNEIKQQTDKESMNNQEIDEESRIL